MEEAHWIDQTQHISCDHFLKMNITLSSSQLSRFAHFAASSGHHMMRVFWNMPKKIEITKYAKIMYIALFCLFTLENFDKMFYQLSSTS